MVNPEPLDDPPTPASPEPEAAAEAGIGAVDDEIGGGCVGGSGKNSVFLAVFKVFVVVVLALSTKGLVVGVTMIAFLLLFLELVGKRVACLWRPCPDARMGFEGLIGRVCAILSPVWPQKGLLVQRATTYFDPAEPTRETVGPANSSLVVEEFRVVESKFEMVVVPVENNSSLGPEGESISLDPRWMRVDTEGEVRVVEEDARAGLGSDARKQNRKIKSKIIQRIVPKKLRTSKKGKKREWEPDPDASITVAAYLGDCGTGAGREGEAEGERGEQGEDADKSRSSKADVEEPQHARCGNKGSDQLLAGETSSTLATISRACPESEASAEYARSAKKRRLVLAVVLLVILAGLVGGRFLAFVLTFGCATTMSIWASRRSFCSAKDRSRHTDSSLIT